MKQTCPAVKGNVRYHGDVCRLRAKHLCNKEKLQAHYGSCLKTMPRVFLRTDVWRGDKEASGSASSAAFSPIFLPAGELSAPPDRCCLFAQLLADKHGGRR